MLERAVVQVEPEPRQPALARVHQRVLSSRASLQQKLTLDEWTGRLAGLLEPCLCGSTGPGSNDQCRPGRLPAAYRYSQDQALRLPLPACVEGPESDRPEPPCRRRVADGDETFWAPGLVFDPQRGLGGG